MSRCNVRVQCLICNKLFGTNFTFDLSFKVAPFSNFGNDRVSFLCEFFQYAFFIIPFYLTALNFDCTWLNSISSFDLRLLWKTFVLYFTKEHSFFAFMHYDELTLCGSSNLLSLIKLVCKHHKCNEIVVIFVENHSKL